MHIKFNMDFLLLLLLVRKPARGATIVPDVHAFQT